ncbi:zinc ABC transporter substrate-binding protein AztC [Actinomadura sp. WAC 06369]|uniref:zinc ABC transporter substrate-binding protein AztC n=1 Tax=Actinomadura sp. WAC 06369 TaxID=2203193 RepID=UPI000F784A6A|nr:zinc ABC transporter substrate-binding protein AztC [Actinomadura sp. WAC 06369]RSN68296.1 zinc ABC transporter substrate-binding protein [Actinomadura sp. WAC 06369]
MVTAPAARPADGRRRDLAALRAALLAVLCLAVAGCSVPGSKRTGIVVTTNILGDVARAVAGDRAEVTVLMEPGADPHSFGVSARDAARIEEAALLIHNGLGLEEGVARNVRAAEEQGVPVLAVGAEVDPIPYAGGDTARAPDPHFWTDPVRMLEAVDVIADRIVEHVDGIDEAGVRAAAAAYRAEVAELHAHMRGAFARIPPDRRKLVTNHHVFGYLARRYGFEVVGAVIPSGTTLASPSGSDLKSLADAVRGAGVRTVFADSSQPDRLARVMARETGLDIAVVPLHSESLTGAGGGAPTYLRMMRANTAAITEGLAAR